EDLVEAIALAHDLGHPPFGHAGEEALRGISRKNGRTFEHNLQALRVVDELEDRYPDFPGLDLTWEVREGIARHFTFFDQPEPLVEFAEWKQGGVESQIASVADMIAYCTHDLEDALEMGFLSTDDLRKDVRLWTYVEDRKEYVKKIERYADF